MGIHINACTWLPPASTWRTNEDIDAFCDGNYPPAAQMGEFPCLAAKLNSRFVIYSDKADEVEFSVSVLFTINLDVLSESA